MHCTCLVGHFCTSCKSTGFIFIPNLDRNATILIHVYNANNDALLFLLIQSYRLIILLPIVFIHTNFVLYDICVSEILFELHFIMPKLQPDRLVGN